MDDLKLRLDVKSVEKNLPLIILLLSTILGIYLVAPLFKDGILLNIDHSSHFSRAWCLEHQGMLPPSNWCAEWQAGFPTSSYYYPIIDMLMVAVASITSLGFAYKIIIALALFMPAIGAYVFLRVVGKSWKHEGRLAAAFAYAIFLFNPGSWHIGGYEEIVLVGMWPQVMSSGFLLVSLALFIRFLEKPSYTRLVFAAASTVLFTHPFTLVAGAIAYASIVVFRFAFEWKESVKDLRWLVLFFASAFLFNSYYIIPLIFNVAYISRPETHFMAFAEFKAYLWDKINWQILLAGALGLATALAGFLKSMKKTVKDHLPLLAIAAGLLLDFALSFTRHFDGPWFIGIRMEVFVATIIFLFAASFLEFMSGVSFRIEKKKVSVSALLIAIIFCFAIYPMADKSVELSKNLILVPEDQLSMLYSPLSQLSGGRMVIEETLYNAGQNFISFTHMHMLIPVYSGKEIVGIPFHYPPKKILDMTEKGYLFNKKLEDYAPGEMEYLFSHFNIRFVAAHTPWYIGFFENRSKAKYPLGPFTIFEMNTTSSYIEIDRADGSFGGSSVGRVLREDFSGTHAKADVVMNEAGRVALKVNPYPNWKVYLDGRRVKSTTCDDILCTDVPSGDHTVEFRYGYNLTNHIGYALTVITIIFSAYMLRKEKSKG